MEADLNGTHREVTVGRVNAMGSQEGTLDRFVRQFTYDRVADGVYVVNTAALSSGEYAFYASSGATGGTAGKLFDFGVDGVARPEEDVAALAAKHQETESVTERAAHQDGVGGRSALGR